MKLVFFIWLGLNFFCVEQLFAEKLFHSPQELNDWKERARRHFVKLTAAGDEAAIVELSDYVYKLNRQMMEPETDDIRIEATRALISIPGHAKFYRAELERLREMVKKEPLFAFQYGEAQANLSSNLRYMPSPETVSVMGDLLNDPEGRNGKAVTGDPVFVGDTINCKMAVGVLSHLKIEKPPLVKASPGGYEDVDAWRQWWDEIESGKRTYRFVGSPVEYGPDGPVSAKELSRREHDRQSSPRTGNAGAQEVASPPESLGIGSKVAAGIALALLAAGSWFAFGRRKQELH